MRTRTRSVVLLVLLAFAARPARAVEFEVRIPAGDVTLAGTLHLPDGAAGPVPGTVIVHGSGKATREQNRVLVDRVRGSGLAVLSYDKRGVGASTGRYRDVNARSSLAAIPELADDAAAALRWLRARAEVDSTRTGFVGASQAGWIIPLAAVREASARFGVIFSGPAVSVGREIAYSALAGEDPGSKQGLTDE
jgi:hypothetical protein